ncbi:MAG: lysine exporter LysO family protein, partial [Bacteroides sp.]|nr:lysine exporter LysO family protein [Bacteroides sp.]
LVKYFGKLAPISVGGATTMDTTLPIITQYSGKEFAIASIYHGFIVDLSVPFLVTFFCLL